MGIYIDGMEMPKEGSWTTVRIYPDGTCARPNWQGDCTLIKGTKAVPVSPHGDLIDREPFVQFIKTHWDSYDQWFVEQLEARPTIIPAEPAEEGD